MAASYSHEDDGGFEDVVAEQCHGSETDHIIPAYSGGCIGSEAETCSREIETSGCPNSVFHETDDFLHSNRKAGE